MNAPRTLHSRRLRLLAIAGLAMACVVLGSNAASAATPTGPSPPPTVLTPIGPTRPTSVPTKTLPGGWATVPAPIGTLPQTGNAHSDIVAGLGAALMLMGTCLLLAIRRPR